MNEQIKKRLHELALLEYENTTAGEGGTPQRFYARPGRFIIERRRISDISTGTVDAPITLRTHPTNLYFPDHSHDFIEIMYVYSGKITHNIGNKRVTVSEGDAIILGLGARHSIEPASEYDLGLNVIIAREEYEKLLSDLGRTRAMLLYTMLECRSDGFIHLEGVANTTLSLAADALISASLLDTPPDTQNIRYAMTLFLSVLSGIGKERTAPSKNERLLAYVKSSYSTATLTEAAELLSLSPSYLSRLCKYTFGKSFKELLMEERFLAASGLLIKTDMPIGEIIAAVGYENSSYFHKEFKKRFGTTPSEYKIKQINQD